MAAQLVGNLQVALCNPSENCQNVVGMTYNLSHPLLLNKKLTVVAV